MPGTGPECGAMEGNTASRKIGSTRRLTYMLSEKQGAGSINQSHRLPPGVDSTNRKGEVKGCRMVIWRKTSTRHHLFIRVGNIAFWIKHSTKESKKFIDHMSDPIGLTTHRQGHKIARAGPLLTQTIQKDTRTHSIVKALYRSEDIPRKLKTT